MNYIYKKRNELINPYSTFTFGDFKCTDPLSLFSLKYFISGTAVILRLFFYEVEGLRTDQLKK